LAHLDHDIIVMGTHPFVAAVPLGDWQLARTLARRGRVLWVDPPASLLAPRRGAASSAMYRRMPVHAGDGLLVGCPVVPSGRVRPAHARVVDALVAAQIRRWMRQLAMTDVDLISFSPRFGTLRGIPRRSLTLWLKDRDWASEDHRLDDWLRFRMEEVALEADVVVGVSDVLVADCRAHGVDAHRIPNGCDTEHHGRPMPAPALFEHLGRPRVIFSGAWNWRVDADLVAAAAGRMPDFTFVLLGAAARPIPVAANVHATGALPYADLPAYLQAGDVGVVPYRRSDFNDASCPLKVFEYLAAGLPVVTTGVDTGGLPRQLVRPVDDVDGFVAAVEDLAGRDFRDACRSEAARHSWEVRADALLTAIDRPTSTPPLVATRRTS
jgi:glycosyltransferase involved in cell wall biosynthesis